MKDKNIELTPEEMRFFANESIGNSNREQADKIRSLKSLLSGISIILTGVLEVKGAVTTRQSRKALEEALNLAKEGTKK